MAFSLVVLDLPVILATVWCELSLKGVLFPVNVYPLAVAVCMIPGEELLFIDRSLLSQIIGV